MPVPLSGPQAAGDAADRLPMLEREVGALRRELNALRGQTSGDGHHHTLMGWVTMAMAALALLVSVACIFAQMKH